MGFSPREVIMERNQEADRKHLKRALELAEKGRGLVSPSPLVGSVITDMAGEVVGEGTYFFKDIVHAEVVALNEAGERAKGGTAYISLEPHSHHGRTKPCTEALVGAGIKRVVAPIEDPNPLVSGKGFEYLVSNGVEVEVGLLAKEARLQNEAFIVWHQKRRPFVHLKLAVSLDGKIATKTGESQWITGSKSRERVHEIRNSSDAILVGVNTVLADDPSLTDRSKRDRVRDLVRIVLDRNGRTPANAKVYDGSFPTLIYSGAERDSKYTDSVEMIANGNEGVTSVLEDLYEREIQSLLVEGGGEIAASFIKARLVDRVTFFIAPKIIGGKESVNSVGGEGIKELKDALQLSDLTVKFHGDDIEVSGVPKG